MKGIDMRMEDCIELQEALEEVERAYGVVAAICARIADGEPSAGRASAEVPKKSGVRRAAKRKAPAVRKAAARGRAVGDDRHAEGEAQKVTFHPHMKVECSFCGTQTGTRKVGPVPYPYRHKNDATGDVCPGCKKPAKIPTG
jgi:hypothetical protein